MDEDLWMLACALGLVAGLILWGGYAVDEAACNAQARSFDREYTIMGGCMIRHQDQWIPFSKYRAR